MPHAGGWLIPRSQLRFRDDVRIWRRANDLLWHLCQPVVPRPGIYVNAGLCVVQTKSYGAHELFRRAQLSGMCFKNIAISLKYCIICMYFAVRVQQAPYLPWVLLCCSMILGNTVWVDIIGMGVGHIYYVLEDVYPQLSNGFRLIKTPYFL